jgi:hypothetical protein
MYESEGVKEIDWDGGIVYMVGEDWSVPPWNESGDVVWPDQESTCGLRIEGEYICTCMCINDIVKPGVSKEHNDLAPEHALQVSGALYHREGECVRALLHLLRWFHTWYIDIFFHDHCALLLGSWSGYLLWNIWGIHCIYYWNTDTSWLCWYCVGNWDNGGKLVIHHQVCRERDPDPTSSVKVIWSRRRKAVDLPVHIRRYPVDADANYIHNYNNNVSIVAKTVY